MELMIHRLAIESDFEDVFHLYMDQMSNPYLTYDIMSKDDFRKEYRELLKTSTLFVVESDKNIVATYRLIPKANRQAHIVYLGGFTIRSSLQGKGLGATVLEAIKEKAFAEGKERIELTVDVDNERAINLYKRVGFEMEGRVKKSYKLGSTGLYYDEYLMGLTR
jgi:RimJ/RimL family protein N-acetyltransferase